jgi:hypothetical protein
MARPFHVHIPLNRLRGERAPQPAALLLILALALLAAVWMKVPPVASLLPTPPPS